MIIDSLYLMASSESLGICVGLHFGNLGLSHASHYDRIIGVPG